MGSVGVFRPNVRRVGDTTVNSPIARLKCDGNWRAKLVWRIVGKFFKRRLTILRRKILGVHGQCRVIVEGEGGVKGGGGVLNEARPAKPGCAGIAAGDVEFACVTWTAAKPMQYERAGRTGRDYWLARGCPPPPGPPNRPGLFGRAWAGRG